MTEVGGTTEIEHSQMRILDRFFALVQKILYMYSQHCPLTNTIRLRIQGTACVVSKSIVTAELLESSRCIQ